jgi:hypothetical protein
MNKTGDQTEIHENEVWVTARPPKTVKTSGSKCFPIRNTMHKNFLGFVFFTSPTERGGEDRERGESTNQLASSPSPLLHRMEERELLRLPLCRVGFFVVPTAFSRDESTLRRSTIVAYFSFQRWARRLASNSRLAVLIGACSFGAGEGWAAD